MIDSYAFVILMVEFINSPTVIFIKIKNSTMIPFYIFDGQTVNCLSIE